MRDFACVGDVNLVLTLTGTPVTDGDVVTCRRRVEGDNKEGFNKQRPVLADDNTDDCDDGT